MTGMNKNKRITTGIGYKHILAYTQFLSSPKNPCLYEIPVVLQKFLLILYSCRSSLCLCGAKPKFFASRCAAIASRSGGRLSPRPLEEKTLLAALAKE